MLLVSRRAVVLLAAILFAVLLVPQAAQAEDVDGSQIFFPVQVQDSLRYSDNWGDCRSGCSRRHLGVDMMSDQMTPVFAAQGGTIYDYEDYCNADRTYCSYYLLLDGDDGRMYFYVHLNDDTPGRPNGCDHRGGYGNAVSPRLFDAYEQGNLKGLRVERGEHLGYLGSSGNAGCRVDHLHFEVWNGEGWTGHGEGSGSINPYPPVRAAQDVGNVWGPDWTPTPPAPSARVAGVDRIETAVELSRKAFPDGSDTVVIAPATAYQEAMVAAPLAATLDAPVLLAWPEPNERRDAVPAALAEEIDRLGAEYALVVGAPRRLATAVVDELVAKTDIAIDDVQRVGDPDPATMSAEVAEYVLGTQGIEVPTDGAARSGQAATSTEHMIAPLAALMGSAREGQAAGDAPSPVDPLLAAGVHPEGLGWPDALAASVLGSRQLAPVLLTPFGRLHEDVARILGADGVRDVRIAGGEKALSAEAEAEVAETGHATRRLAGADRYTTSQAVAAELLEDGASLSTLAVATGLDFPDALASGPAMASLNRAFVILPGTRMVPQVQDWLEANAAGIDELEVIGGANAIADSVVQQAAVAANSDNG